MKASSLDLVFLGLTLSSSWGNGHATTYRALLRGLAEQGHRVLFLERDVPWYADHRDLAAPPYCDLAFYRSLAELTDRHGAALERADAVVVGSYVPQGVEVLSLALARAQGIVAFYDIDTPVTLAKLLRQDEEYVARWQVPQLDVYFSFTSGPTLRRLELEFGARRARPLYCSVQEDCYQPSGGPLTWDLGYLGTYSPDRQPTLEKLLLEPARRLPDHRFVVAGPQYPSSIIWPANVERIDHLPPSEHASFYGRQRFTLNVTRSDMVAAGWSPSVRLFEAAAARTPIVSDSWPGLTELFPDGEAIVVAHSTDDVVELLSRTPRSRRDALARAAHALVLAEHTGSARARQFVRELEAAELGERRLRTAAASAAASG